MTFTLNAFTPEFEFELLKQMYSAYINDPWSITSAEVVTPNGVFVNKGGFNGKPSDLWLYKKGTIGATKKTFWRTGFGSKKSGFRVFVYDMRSIYVTKDNMNEVAKLVGAKLVEQGGIKYFTI